MTGANVVAGALRTARERRPARWLAALAPAVAFAAAAGPVGAVAGLAVAVAGLWSAPAAAALAHVWLVALLPPDPVPGTLVAVEAAVLAVLCVPAEGGVVRSAAATVAGALLLGVVAWLALRRTGSLVVAGGALLVTAAVVAGAVDRVAHVVLAGGDGGP